MITASYFQTFGVPVLSGRVFDEHDTEASPPVVLVGRRLAERLWAGETPLGRDVVLSDSPVTRQATVVGVVGDVKHFGLEAEPTADVYVPIRQVPEFTIQWLTNNMYWGLRTTVDPATLREAVRKEVHIVDRDVPASAMRSMDEVLAVAIAPRRVNLWLVRVFATAALLLAAAGVYAVTAFGVASRRRELAIRSALGAGHERNIRAVLDDVLRPIVVGLAAGAIILGLSMPALRSMVFGVETIEPMMFASVAAAMLLVSLLAATLGAVRLRAIDPLAALRE
jgi:hypothetical protein